MYKWQISEELEGKLNRLSKKNKSLYEQILKKINEVVNSSSVEHYKNLRHNMKNSKRVYVGHFVLIFQFFSSKNLINFDDFDHHDKIYR